MVLVVGQEMRKHVLWRDEAAAQWEETRESLEKFMLVKLHRHLFAPHERADLEQQDQSLHARLAALAFLSAEHLDIKSVSKRPPRPPAQPLPFPPPSLPRLSTNCRGPFRLSVCGCVIDGSWWAWASRCRTC